jgi:hypothetical protein
MVRTYDDPMPAGFHFADFSRGRLNRRAGDLIGRPPVRYFDPVNGEFQQQRYLKVLMSGAATAMWNGFRRVNAA